MKKLFSAIIMVTMLVCVCAGCDGTKKAYGEAPHVLTIVDETMGYAIYKHDTTGVHYLRQGGADGAALCVMVNADGTPYTGAQEGNT